MKKDLIVIILSLLALILIVFLLILPSFTMLSLSRAGLAFEKDRLKEAETQNQKLNLLDQKYKDNPKELEKLISALPKETDFANLLINLENLTSANGLVMHSVDFKTVEKNSGFIPPIMGGEEIIFPQENQGVAAQISQDNQKAFQFHKTIEISLNLEGGYDNLKKYLKAIEENPRLMDVTSLSYGGRNGQDANLYSFGLNLNVYYQ